MELETQILKRVPQIFPYHYGRILGLFFVLLFQVSHSQIYVSEDAVLYLGDEVGISAVEDSLSVTKETKVKIYTESATSVIVVDSDNYDIVELGKPDSFKEDKLLAKQKLPSEKKTSTPLPSAEKSQPKEVYSYTFRETDPEDFYSLSFSHSSSIVPAPDHQLKLSAESYTLFFLTNNAAYFVVQIFALGADYSHSFTSTLSVRPPPAVIA